MKLWELREKHSKHHRDMAELENTPMHRKMRRTEDEFEDDEDFEGEENL